MTTFTTRAAALSLALAITAASGAAHVSAQSTTTDRFGHGHDDPRPKPELKFTPCPENATLDCGYLTVPLNYAKPWAGTLQIAVIRAKATDPAQRIGVLVGNPGGPGLSGVDFVLGGVGVPAFQRLRARFDIISFDPRGVARSGQMRCQTDTPPVPTDLEDDAAVGAFLDELGHRFYQACRDQSGAVVDHLGTNNVARDIDRLRQALGERQISYASGSYGSELGAVYASLFPERLRAGLLDGAAPPEHHDYLIESWSEYLAGFETALQYLDRLCRRSAGCRLAESGVVATFDEVSAQLQASPAPTPSGTLLTETRFKGLVASLLGIERLYPLIVDALADARGGDYALLAQLLPVARGGTSALVPITCNNYGTRLSGDRIVPIDDVVGRRNPRFADRFFVAELTALCNAFPRTIEPSIVRNVRGRTAAPLLVIGTEFDPNTPFSGARRLADALGMERSLFVYEGGGHTAFNNGSACVAATIENYLINLEVPKEGASCPPQTLDFSSAAALTSRSSTLRPVDSLRFSGASPLAVPSTLRTR